MEHIAWAHRLNSVCIDECGMLASFATCFQFLFTNAVRKFPSSERQKHQGSGCLAVRVRPRLLNSHHAVV